MGDLARDAARPPLPQEDTAGAVGDFIDRAHQRLLKVRRKVLEYTPAFIVNNASNFISAAHLGGEMFMLKSNGVDFLKSRAPDGSINYLTTPLNNIGRGIVGMDRVGTHGEAQQNWRQILSTSTGLANWSLGLAVPEGRDSQQQIDDMVKLRREHPVKYFVKRALEGVNVFAPRFKRQRIGLFTTVTGLLSFLGGFTNVNQRKHNFFENTAHSVNGLVTALGGLQLWFATDREDAWSRYGATMTARIPLLPLVVYGKYKGGDRWRHYTAGAATFQGAALLSYLIGGAEKRPDGTIVDHKAEVEEAKMKYPKHTHHRGLLGLFAPQAASPRVTSVVADGVGVANPEATKQRETPGIA